MPSVLIVQKPSTSQRGQSHTVRANAILFASGDDRDAARGDERDRPATGQRLISRAGSEERRRTPAAPWLFADVKLRHGQEFSSGGIEIDSLGAASPREVEVVAEIPNLLGPGRTAQMTYYETARGARVFAAGAFTLAGHARDPSDRRLLDNVWERLTSG